MVRWQVATSDIMPYTIHRAEDLSPSMLMHIVAILQHNALSFMPIYGVATLRIVAIFQDYRYPSGVLHGHHHLPTEPQLSTGLAFSGGSGTLRCSVAGSVGCNFSRVVISMVKLGSTPQRQMMTVYMYIHT
jgi:hypothetical protein